MDVKGSSHDLISGTTVMKPTENHSKDSWYPNQDFNQESADYSLKHNI
jgi:hypothetical protein